MLQRYSVRLRIYSWFMKYLPLPWRLQASSLSLNGNVGRRQQSAQYKVWENNFGGDALIGQGEVQRSRPREGVWWLYIVACADSTEYNPYLVLNE